MPIKTVLLLLALVAALFIGPGSTRAQEASVRAKSFPTGFFYRYHKIPIPEKEKVLARIDATLKKLSREGYGLIVKGAVLEKPDPGVKTYPQLTILDESGLIIIARRVSNLYYQYHGPAPINRNIYLIITHARVNVPESYIRYGFVVEGDYRAYAHKFVHAILEDLERGAAPRDPPPARQRPTLR